MSKIEELLKNEKVEWKKLGDVCEIVRGIRVTKKELIDNGQYPVVSGGIGYMGYVNQYNRDEDTITIAQYGTAGYVCWQKEKFWANDVCFSVYPNYKVVKKYLYHFLLQKQEYLYSISNKSAVPYSISKEKILKIEIPIPSIETQERIVKTLDKFTNYVTELQAELQARTKQYEYYRDMLLSEEYLNKISAKINGLVSKDYELKLTTLGEIGEIQMCKRILKEQTSSQGEVPFYKIGTFGKEADSFISQDLFREYREKYNYPKNGEILLSASGTIGKTVIFDGEDAYFQDSNIVWISHNERLVLNKYLYYFYQIVKWNPSTGGTINRLYNYNLKNIKITLPPIEIQNKVVEILDKFQSLLADTKGLLPQEIEQRQKQYEFYREKLLTFNENSAKLTHTHNLISNSYFDLLKEAASISNVKLFEVEWKVLGSIGVFENGTGMPKSLFDETGSVGAIHYGHIYTKYNLFVNQPIVRVTKKNAKNLKVVNKGDLVIAKTSENIEDVMKTVAYLGEEYAVTGGHSAIFRHKENPKYLSYVFNGAKYLLRQKNKLARGVKVIELSTTDMEKIKIPVPPIKVQEHIVEILDKFDAIVNDISKGLPKEIALRQKQYEYYREKLLSFEK